MGDYAQKVQGVPSEILTALRKILNKYYIKIDLNIRAFNSLYESSVQLKLKKNFVLYAVTTIIMDF